MAIKAAIPPINMSASTGSKSKKSIGKTIPSMKNFIVCNCQPSKRMPIVGSLIAEFIGTFIFVISFFQMQGNPLFVGFTLIGLFLIIGGISGAHMNPAITIGAWVTRKIGWIRGLGYIVAQGFGATVAWLVLTTFLNGAKSATVDLYSSSAASLFHAATITEGKEWYLFMAELLAVAILAFGFASALRLKREKVAAAMTAGLAMLIALYIGLTLSSTFLTEANTSLTFLNPVLAFAANGISTWDIWPIAIFILAPVAGGIIGFVLNEYLHTQEVDKK